MCYFTSKIVSDISLIEANPKCYHESDGDEHETLRSPPDSCEDDDGSSEDEEVVAGDVEELRERDHTLRGMKTRFNKSRNFLVLELFIDVTRTKALSLREILDAIKQNGESRFQENCMRKS